MNANMFASILGLGILWQIFFICRLLALFKASAVPLGFMDITWVGSLVLMAASCFAHLAVGSCHTPTVYLLRIVFTCSVAGVFGSSMTFVSARVPPVRVR